VLADSLRYKCKTTYLCVTGVHGSAPAHPLFIL
jgi:hypothetical protein